MLECDRGLVFSRGLVVAELTGDEISEDAIVNASFGGERESQTQGAAESAAPRRRAPVEAGHLFRYVPFASLAIVFALMTAMNPLVASSFGLDLLLAPAVEIGRASCRQRVCPSV